MVNKNATVIIGTNLHKKLRKMEEFDRAMEYQRAEKALDNAKSAGWNSKISGFAGSLNRPRSGRKKARKNVYNSPFRREDWW